MLLQTWCRIKYNATIQIDQYHRKLIDINFVILIFVFIPTYVYICLYIYIYIYIYDYLDEAEWRIFASVTQAITGSDNCLSPDRRQAIIRNNDGILLIGLLRINFSDILIKIHIFK